MEAVAPGISYVDLTHLGRRRVIAATVVESDDGVAVIDPGPTTCLDTLRRHSTMPASRLQTFGPSS